MCHTSAKVRTPLGRLKRRDLLAGVEEALRVERPLDPGVQVERGLRPLTRELAALGPADAVLPRDRASKPDGKLEEVLRGSLGPLELCFAVRFHEEGRMQVAV